MQNGENMYWCYQCNQGFSLQGQDVLCPSCGGGFVQELNELANLRSGDSVIPDSVDASTGVPHIFDAVYTLLGENGLTTRSRFVDFFDLITRDENAGIRPHVDVRGRSSSGAGRRARQIGSNDFLLEQEFEEMMHQISYDDASSPPPASLSAIDGMPTIRITRTHLQENAQCPVCKGEFEMDTEAKMMPCHHMYHSNCIVPWLAQHNSCPVCRFEMPSTLGTGAAHGSHHRAQGTNSSNGSSHGRGITVGGIRLLGLLIQQVPTTIIILKQGGAAHHLLMDGILRLMLPDGHLITKHFVFLILLFITLVFPI